MSGIPVILMRGGTSKGPFFLASDLPNDIDLRDKLLCKIMGSPDARQIDGIGGGHLLTSKVAIVSKSRHADYDVDYLFLQVTPDSGAVSDSQNCGNMLAAVGPFAVERGLVEAQDGETTIRVFMVNSASRADLIIQTPARNVSYQGTARIDGVPGSHAPILQNYFGTAGAQCGALLPTGNQMDVIETIECTLVDNGMPSVLMRASDFGLTGYESSQALEVNSDLKSRLESIRLIAGKMMNLGDVSNKTIPKMCLIAKPQHGAMISTRTFIPHRVHQAVGVLAAASNAAGCMFPNSVAKGLAQLNDVNPCRIDIEHPSGALTVELEWDGETVVRTGLLRTANKLIEGQVYP